MHTLNTAGPYVIFDVKQHLFVLGQFQKNAFAELRKIVGRYKVKEKLSIFLISQSRGSLYNCILDVYYVRKNKAVNLILMT